MRQEMTSQETGERINLGQHDTIIVLGFDYCLPF